MMANVSVPLAPLQQQRYRDIKCGAQYSSRHLWLIYLEREKEVCKRGVRPDYLGGRREESVGGEELGKASQSNSLPGPKKTQPRWRKKSPGAGSSEGGETETG